MQVILLELFLKKIKPRSLFITDSLFAYRTLSSYCKLIPKRKYRFKKFNIQKINNLHSNLKRFVAIYKGVSTKYLANYLALFKYIFDKSEDCPILKVGEHPYLNTNFKGCQPIFE